MSEVIYACILALYPRRFREAYGEDAMQVFRDRARDETGVMGRLRLWMDIFWDVVGSLIREHRRAAFPLASVIPSEVREGIPGFHFVGSEAPSGGSLFLAGVLSVATFASLIFSAVHGHNRSISYAAAVWEEVAPDSDQQRVIDVVIKHIKQYYFDPQVAQKIADVLLAYQEQGDYDAMDGETLAASLTKQIRDDSNDMHLEVVYSEETLPNGPREPSADEEASYRKWLKQTNCSFETVKLLPHNIGYLKLDSFADVSVCKSEALDAMATLNHADAIIFDLRDNRGGDGNMVSFIASYLFDHPEFLYDPRSTPTLQSWMQPRAGSRLTDKPAYVLTSNTTISAAEQFAYDLKMLRRVKIVGEKTRGSAHAGVFYRIDDHFGMGIPRVKAFNPFSANDWEGTGVAPDVPVKAPDALQTAEKLAEGNVRRALDPNPR